MMAFLSHAYVGRWLEVAVRILAGVLLLSAVNTVITDMISVQYLLSRDGEIPRFFQGLNRFGVPWIGAVIATLVPCVVLVVSHDVEGLAALYAIGVVGAVAINITLVAKHPRLHGWPRKIIAGGLGLVLMAIWITLACTKHQALIFVAIVMGVGLTARFLTKKFAGTVSPTKLLREAISEQLTPEQLAMPKLMLATAGSARLAEEAMHYAKQRNCALVVSFIREISLSDRGPGEEPTALDNDLAAQAMFAEFLHAGHRHEVPVIPFYDAGRDPVELLAEAAAVNGVDEILIGSSRRGVLHQLIKGSFQRRLESLLPAEIRVHVLQISAEVGSPAEGAPVRAAS
jgi:nucleotide-binding universal stress UspA family protein